MNVRLCLPVCCAAHIGMLFDVVLFVPHRFFAANEQQGILCGQHPYLVRSHQVTPRLLIVDRTGAAASFCLPTGTGMHRLFPQQLRYKLQRCGFVAAAEEQEGITVPDDALPFVFVERLDALDVLHNDIDADVVAAAGSQHLGIAVRLGNVGPLILYHADRHGKPPIVPFISPQVELLKTLCEQHTDEIIHTAVVDGDNAKDSALALTQRSKVHLIGLHHGRILREDKRRQPHGSGHKDALGGLSSNKMSIVF